MAVTYNIDEDKNILVEKWVGKFHEEEIVGFYENLAEDPKLKPGLSTLIVTTEMTVADLSSSGIRMIASSFDKRQRRTGIGKIAMVAPKDLVYGFGRMFMAIAESMSQPPEVLVFRDMRAALKWLDN